MDFKNIKINGLKVPVWEKSTVRDIIEKFFDLRCEFLVNVNSKPLHESKYATRAIKENDNLQIVTYSKYCYKLQKRTIFKPSEGNKEET